MKRLLALTSASLLLSSSALAQSIFFTGFNADGNDNLAFVTLTSLSTGAQISFSDNERSSTGWKDANEAGFTWTASSNIAAGTIVTLNDLGDNLVSTSNLGTITPIAAAGGDEGVAASDESIWAFTGSYGSPASFLAVIGNDVFGNTNNDVNPAIASLFISGDEDVMAYTGPRSGQSSFAAYLPFLTNAGNWITQDGSGDQHTDGTAPDVPFSTTAFTIIPEPSTTAAIMAGVVLLGVILGRRRFARG